MEKKLLEKFFAKQPQNAWSGILDYLWQEFSQPLPSAVADAKITERDRNTAELDNLLSGCAWELWDSFESSTKRTSDAIAEYWMNTSSGKAVLILDGLSLREIPWLLQQAKERNYIVQNTGITCAELPADTTSFAKSLGFPQRSALSNNGAGKSHKLTGANTECSKLPFVDCAQNIPSDPNIVLWHEWPDERMHHLDEPGIGYSILAKEARDKLCSDDFWTLVERLTTGRKLLITSDHGYAYSGIFPDITDKEQVDYLKKQFKSGRHSNINSGQESKPYWVPPLTKELETKHGKYIFVLGRKKWKSPGGYPTLTHGGLSLLEVTVPFIELTR